MNFVYHEIHKGFRAGMYREEKMSQIDLGGQKILIIDDKPANLGVVADYLADDGFDILVSQDGESGLAMAEEEQPGIILLDIMMPGIDGFETCRRLKANPTTQQIPIIFMTALTEIHHKVEGFAAGGVDYVTKPLQQEEVLARVKTHLQIRAQAEKLSEQAKRLQEQATELQQKNELLLELNASKDKFFSIVAHDLKGPFQPLLGSTELLAEIAETLTPQEIKELGQSLHRSAKNVYNLLESLLTWSRLQQGRMEYQPIKLDLKQIADQTCQLLTESATAKGIALQSKVKAGIFVYVDENMLNTVIRNLTSNALKFTPLGGQVTIRANLELATKVIEIAVIDTGVGISQADIAKLFKIAVHHSTLGTAKEKGTGLGLIICKEMVEYNGGCIWVESELGKGTAVKFTVPLDKTTSIETLAKMKDEENDLPSPAIKSKETFIVPTAKEMAVLHDLVMTGDMQAIKARAKYLEQANEQYIPFARKLTELAKGFEEEEISALVKQYLP